MSRKNSKAGQPNRQAQMTRRTKNRTAKLNHRQPDRVTPIHLVKTREESMRDHPAGKGLVSVDYALEVNE